MCRYHAVPVRVPSNPQKAQLHLLQSHSSQHPIKRSTHIHIHNRNDVAPTMDPSPATANTRNNGASAASSFTELCFLQEEDCDDDEKQDKGIGDCESDTECSTPQHPLLFREDQLRRILQGVCSCRTQLEAKLLKDVREAMRMIGTSAPRRNNTDLQRFVVKNLRCEGYNAGICKSRWEQTNGYPAGDYEFIDVINVGRKGSHDRVLVDIDFRAQFEIARPTPQYAALVEVLPDLVVGSADKVRDIIWIMSDAARRSLKARGMHLPPWRKKRYLEAKWLASHKRITQFAPSHLQGLMEWNAKFLHPKNILRCGVNGKGSISGLGKALAVAQAVTDNNTNDVYILT